VPGEPDDEKRHAQIHVEYFSGPEIPAVRLIPHTTTIGELSIYVVDQTCPIEIRREISHVAMVAQRSMTDYPAGYDGTITEDDQRLFIAADGIRIVSMVLTAFDDIFWRLVWKLGGSIKLEDQIPLERRSYKVARVWTASGYRRKGLTCQLIKIASDILQCNIVDIGWELPFTRGGTNLVKRLCPDFFWGCGDSFSLRKSLDEIKVKNT
jgi:hypothetical protein